MNGLIDVLRLLDRVTKSMLQDKLINSLPLLYLSRRLWEKEGGLPYPFLKFEKSALILAKKGPHSVHLWSTYSIQNLILRVSKRKNSKIFLRACFFLVLYTNFLSKCPNSAKQSPVLKNFWLRICCPLLWQEKFVLHLSIISGS